MAIKVVFIDWFGTLSDSLFWGHLADPNHPKHNLFTKAGKALFENLSHSVNPWMRGEYTTEEVVKNISELTSLPEDELLAEFISGAQKMTVSPEVISIIQAFRNKGVKVVIATDNMDSFTRWTVPALELDRLFDSVLNSFDLKSLKKDFDPEGNSLFFDAYLKQNNLLPEECVLIDDSEDKNSQIQNFGIQYLKINQLNEVIDALKSLSNRLD